MLVKPSPSHLIRRSSFTSFSGETLQAAKQASQNL